MASLPRLRRDDALADVLAALDEHGAASQADVGRRAGIDRSDVVATLNELVRDGFAVRAPDPSDGRRNVVTITTKGRAILERLELVVEAVQEAVLDPLTARERTLFVRLLGKLT